MFSHNGKTLEDPSEIANAFNEYFISIGPSLANQMDKNNNFRKYLRNPSESRLHFEPITEHKTMRIIENLKNKTSTGIDGLSNQLIKMAKNVLVKPLTIIINQMIVTGIFPDQLKISKVIPLYKAKDQTILSNYRPIALLPSISKIFEYVLLEQITNYFLDNNMLSPQQYGFRSNHSTELAALNLVDELTYKLDRGIIPLNIYMDLSKAFDTLIHEILISKLKHYGVRGEAIDLIRSYLYQRQELVEFNGCLSDMRYIETGVPQESVLGPLLFSIYINDLPSCSDMFKMIMYADDTNLLCDFSNDHDIETLLNNELCKITDWLQANKLSLNVNKTKFMVFHSDRRRVVYPVLSINNTIIERVDTFNFLGLRISHDLKWKTHIQTMSQKLSKITGILHRLKEEYPSSILKSIYNTLMLPHLHYCILSWGSQCQEIYKLQKRAIRNIEKADSYRAHTEPIFKSLNLIKVEDMYYLAILKFYSKLINNNLPHYFEDFMPHFTIGATNYYLRNPNLQLPRIKHEFPKFSLRYQLINKLNETPPEILEQAKNCTQSIFINHVRESIVDGYRDTCVNPENCYSCNK